MANYYTDQPELKFHLHHPLMKRIVELKERDFADKDKYEDAPVDFDDAMENYEKMLEITGDVAANIIEPNSESVDEEGPHLENGRMIYASKTYENLDATRKAGLWGVSMPRRYGGLNLPVTPYSMASEMVASADAGFQNIWSLQDCIETLYEFGSEEAEVHSARLRRRDHVDGPYRTRRGKRPPARYAQGNLLREGRLLAA